MDNVQAVQDEWRRRITERLQQLSPDERSHKSQSIRSQLLATDAYRQATYIMSYVALSEEVETQSFLRTALEQGKEISVPFLPPTGGTMLAVAIKDLERDLVPASYGILQPRRDEPQVDAATLDLIVVPGVAFDERGHRLGRGGGYYDRFLADVPDSVVRIGLAFDCQLVDALPTSDHDEPVHRVIRA